MCVISAACSWASHRRSYALVLLRLPPGVSLSGSLLSLTPRRVSSRALSCLQARSATSVLSAGSAGACAGPAASPSQPHNLRPHITTSPHLQPHNLSSQSHPSHNSQHAAVLRALSLSLSARRWRGTTSTVGTRSAFRHSSVALKAQSHSSFSFVSMLL